MDYKSTGLVAYITFIGWLIAFCAGDRDGAKFHMNQALVLHIFALLGVIPCIGQLWLIFIFVCLIMGGIAAANGEEKEVPLLGSIRILK